MKPQATSNKKPRLVCDLPIPDIPNISGTVLVCGQGDMGQLGLGEDDMEKKRPALVPILEKIDIVDICAGGMHSLCLTKNGEIYSFGCNDEGALGRDSSEEGSECTPKIIDLPGKCVKISAGDSHSACLMKDGRVFAWGSFRDSHGNMGLTLEGNKRLPIEIMQNIICCDIASGADHLVILTCNGQVHTIGCGEQGQLGRVSLRAASGESRRGKIDLLRPGHVNVKKAKHIDAIWATTYCTYIRKLNSNEIYAFGLNNYHQLGLKKSNNQEAIINPIITNFENIETIAGGQHHTLVLTKDKKCYAIGRRDYGRLGLGNNLKEDVIELKEIEVLNNKEIIDITCGEAQSFAISKNGHLYAWGMGSNHQLGTGSEDDGEEPILIVSKQTQGKNIIKAASGGQHSIFLIKKDHQNIINNNNDIKIIAQSKTGGKIQQTTKTTTEELKDVNENGNVVVVADEESTKRPRKRKN